MKRQGNDGTKTIRRAAGRRSQALALFLIGAAILAGPAAAAAAPPEGAAILDRYLEVTGGKAAYEAVKNRVIKATLELPAQSIKLDFVLYTARPKLAYTVLESQMVGKIESGVYEGYAWETSTMTGPRLKEGSEELEAVRDANFDLMVNWRKTYPKVEVVGADTVDGVPCWKVVMTPRFGRARTAWYEQEAGLVKQIEITAESPAGALTALIKQSDYRKVDGLLMPHRSETDVAGAKRVLTIHSVEHDVDLPADRFTPPADVQKLIEARKK